MAYEVGCSRQTVQIAVQALSKIVESHDVASDDLELQALKIVETSSGRMSDLEALHKIINYRDSISDDHGIRQRRI